MTETATKIVAPKNEAELRALTAIKTTEAATSYANFMNDCLENAEGYTPITPEQAWTVIYAHRVWQSSETRAAEKEALKAAGAEEAEAKKAAREEAKAKKEQEREEKRVAAAAKKADREAKQAAKATKDLVDELDDDDLDIEDEEVVVEAPKKRRRPVGVSAATI